MKRILVFGRVQGVCFRHYAKKKAQELGIKGYVGNLDDGGVEIIADGKNIKEFIEWCRKGPLFAKVNDIKIENIKNQKFDDFEIRY